MKSIAARCHDVSKNNCHEHQWLYCKSHQIKWQWSGLLQEHVKDSGVVLFYVVSIL